MEKQYETPETNVKMAALKLLRFKSMCELGRKGKITDYVLTIKDVNEILTVAGLPVIMPEELDKKGVEVVL